MISTVIRDLIKSPSVNGLVPGSTLFCEQGSGDQNVLIRTTTTNPWVDMEHCDGKFLRSPIKITVRGWPSTTAYKMACTIKDILLQVVQQAFTTETGSYYVYGVELVTHPTPVPEGTGQVVLAYFNVFYTHVPSLT